MFLLALIERRGGFWVRFREAYTIFCDIESKEYTDEQKGTAILRILGMETHNSVPKAAMLKVIDYLLHLAFDVPEPKEGQP